MSLKQLTVLVPNEKGALVAITDLLSDNKINIRALSIADTAEYGILRMIVDKNDESISALNSSGYLVKTVDVVGVKIGDDHGKLSQALAVLDRNDINVEYLYAFMSRTEKHAYVVLRVADIEKSENALKNEGYHLISDSDIEKL